jgi:hypothetical protein
MSILCRGGPEGLGFAKSLAFCRAAYSVIGQGLAIAGGDR